MNSVHHITWGLQPADRLPLMASWLIEDVNAILNEGPERMCYHL